MVSFQCHACGDVVKKPKLDQHRGRCHAGFDCIDCHTTFNSPAEYKGHTKCISEAEKYQKGLYKGSMQNTTGTTTQNNTSRSLERQDVLSQRGGIGYGSRSMTHENWARGRLSDANYTPLGQPRRMSSVKPSSPASPEQPSPDSKPDVAVSSSIVPHAEGTDKKSKKKNLREDHVTEASTVPKVETSFAEPAADVEGGVKKKEKKRKDKKKESLLVNGVVDEGQPVADSLPEKQEKKKRKRESVAENGIVDEGPAVADPSLDKKQKKKKRKSVSAPMDDIGTSLLEAHAIQLEEEATEVVAKKKKKKESLAPAEGVNPLTDSLVTSENASEEVKKKKNRESIVFPADGAVATSGTPVVRSEKKTEPVEEKRNKKKRESIAVPTDQPEIPAVHTEGEGLDKKSKKKKQKSVAGPTQDIDVHSPDTPVVLPEKKHKKGKDQRVNTSLVPGVEAVDADCLPASIATTIKIADTKKKKRHDAVAQPDNVLDHSATAEETGKKQRQNARESVAGVEGKRGAREHAVGEKTTTTGQVGSNVQTIGSSEDGSGAQSTGKKKRKQHDQGLDDIRNTDGLKKQKAKTSENEEISTNNTRDDRKKSAIAAPAEEHGAETVEDDRQLKKDRKEKKSKATKKTEDDAKHDNVDDERREMRRTKEKKTVDGDGEGKKKRNIDGTEAVRDEKKRKKEKTVDKGYGDSLDNPAAASHEKKKRKLVKGERT